MADEKIEVEVTETGQTMEVVVLKKRVNQIEVVVGEGIHSVKCQLTPTHNKLAYAGNVMGRELIYNRSPDQVQKDIDLADPNNRQFTRRR